MEKLFLSVFVVFLIALSARNVNSFVLFYQPIACQVQPNTASCGLEEQAYYYDVSLRSCEPYIYGGCESRDFVQNRFESLSACQDFCTPPQRDEEDFIEPNTTTTTNA